MAKKLDIKAFGLSGGIIWGAGVLIIGLTAMSGYGSELVNLIGSVYPGYQASVGGAITGGIIGFIDAGIGCAIFAWLYNKLAK